MKDEIVLVDPQVDGPAIVELHGERRTPGRNPHVAFIECNAEFHRTLQDVGTDSLYGLPGRGGEFDFLTNEVVELECCKIRGSVLRRGEQDCDEHEQEKHLPAVQAKHGADYNMAW